MMSISVDLQQGVNITRDMLAGSNGTELRQIEMDVSQKYVISSSLLKEV
jgi:hypothetical protein